MKKIFIPLIFLFIVILLFSVYKIKDNKINYILLGDKYYFKNNLINKNYSDLVADKLKSEKLLNNYSKDFIYDNIRIIDLINEIDKNKKENDYSIQNIIHDSNLILLNIGNNEINYKIKKVDYESNNDFEIYKYLDEVEKDLNNLIKKIKDITEGNIILMGYFNETNNSFNDKYYDYINKKLSKRKDIIFINLLDLLNKKENNLEKGMSVYINENGNLNIYNEIINKIKEIYLKK